MDIYCIKCDTHVGLIRDARLRKGVVFLCSGCNQDRIATEESSDSSNNTIHIKGNSEEEVGEALRRELFGGMGGFPMPPNFKS